ncbi:potassium-transporting ATPase subunit KdpC [Oscillochloris sp. ZM17-4]|uniref:potassium-transporting ATPase subunit KdpC n=1 Tax=Oscillochloris sp. ZM17-4 TaxID=2866714 RepID=UPI002107354D|nr:potassium-transporting ATPase subunit KdpC [Oscillochloris sp. ZM17-4]
MTNQIRPAIVSLLALTLITGLIYPLAVTMIAQAAFPHQANGSLIVVGGQVRGSALIGQPFDDPKYFWGRPSATSPTAYNAAASAGANDGPLSPALAEAVQARIDALRAADPQASGPYPVDLVTASASGLDPQISPAAAAFQVRRVAAARGLSEEQVRQLVAQYTEGRTLGVLGEPRVNVLALNLALDALQ